jgi:hypothetical protein
MNDEKRQLVVAKDDAYAARARLLSSVAQIRDRLSPASLKNDVLSAFHKRSIDVVEKAINRPLVSASIMSALLLFLFRNLIFTSARRRFKEKDNAE